MAASNGKTCSTLHFRDFRRRDFFFSRVITFFVSRLPGARCTTPGVAGRHWKSRPLVTQERINNNSMGIRFISSPRSEVLFHDFLHGRLTPRGHAISTVHFRRHGACKMIRERREQLPSVHMKSMAAIESLACHLRAISATVSGDAYTSILKRFTFSSQRDR